MQGRKHRGRSKRRSKVRPRLTTLFARGTRPRSGAGVMYDGYSLNIHKGSVMRATIARWGNSTGVRIPSDVLRKSGLKPGDLVEAEARPDHSILIRAVKPSRTRAETTAVVTAMIASIKPSTLPDAAQHDGAPAGSEVW